MQRYCVIVRVGGRKLRLTIEASDELAARHAVVAWEGYPLSSIRSVREID